MMVNGALDGQSWIHQCPPPVRAVLAELESAGFGSVLVGGAVRDLALGRPVQDFDIATAALPEVVLAHFKHVIPTGLQHGTVTVVYQGLPIEVTTFRGEGLYSDGRRPDTVQLGVSLEADLARRDFTINAMALDINGRLFDPFNGLSHLRQGRIVAVGNAAARLSEDRLRKLRAVRFMSQLGFSLDQALLESLTEAPCLAGVSGERIKLELDKLLAGAWSSMALETLAKTGLLKEALPELAPLIDYAQDHPAHRYDAYRHTLQVLEALKAAQAAMCLCPLDAFWQQALSWAALFHDAGKPAVRTVDDDGVAHYYGHQEVSVQLLSAVAKRLRFSRRLEGAVAALIEGHMQRPVAEARPIRRWLKRVGDAISPFIVAGEAPKSEGGLLENSGLALAASVQLTLMQADAIGTGTYNDAAYHVALKAQVHAVLSAGAAFTRASLAINGSDLLVAFPELNKERRGMKPLLEALVNHCIETPEDNVPEVLMTFAAEWLGDSKKQSTEDNAAPPQ